MAAAGGTFIDDLLTKGGFRNVFNNSSRYPAVTAEAIRQAGAEVLMLSSEPYPFKQIHIDELQQLLPDTKIVLVDGELFSWYGSRLLHTPAYFAQLQKQLHMAAD
jgi:ABC-type Fe3+-hydroxamate transport system substrate-binding protein